MADSPKFEDLLNKYMKERERSGTWLARRLGVSHSTVSRWLSGHPRPKNPAMVIRIADVLGVHDKEKRKELLVAAGYAYVENEAQPLRVDESPVSGEQSTQKTFSESISIAVAILQERWLDLASLFEKNNQEKHLLTFPVSLLGLFALTLVLILFWPQFRRASPWAPDLRFLITMADAAVQAPRAITAADGVLQDGELRHVLYQKLTGVPGIQGVDWQGVSVLTPEPDLTALDIDVIIQLEEQIQSEQIEVIATVISRDGALLSPPFRDRASLTTPGINACLLELETRLAKQILTILVEEMREFRLQRNLLTADSLEEEPTGDCEAQLLNNEGALLFHEGKLEQAEEKLRAAIALDNEYAGAYNNLGRLLREQGEIVTAIEYFQMALSLQAQDPRFRFNLAVAYTLQGEYEKAITEYQQITQADTAYFEAYNNLGYTYLEQGKLDFAEEELLKALKQNPPQPVVSCIRKNLGRVHFAREDFDAAAGDLELAIAEKNTSCYVEALYYLALAYHTLDLIDQACDTLFDYAFVAEHDEETRADQVGQLFDLWACS